MDYNFKRCLEKKKLVKADIDKELIEKEIVAAESDLKDSCDVLKLGKSKLATITAYYSMFMLQEHCFIQRDIAKKAIFACERL